MVFNKKDAVRTFSPYKVKKLGRRRHSGTIATSRPSTSGSTTPAVHAETGSPTAVRVIVRVRPHNEREQQDNFRTVVKVIDDKMLIFDPKEEENPFFYRGVAQKGRDLLKKQNKELQFIFDRVFDETASNTDIFEGSTKELINGLLDGYNCSVFAYGATGAGKTHTMLGKEDDLGITYRTMAELFMQINAQKDQRDFTLGVSYLEIYNENVQDLLQKGNPLQIRDDGRSGIIVAGLKVMAIQSADELLALLAKGNKSRTQHPTDANQESSRSHAVFQVYINIINKLDGQVKRVKLSMIDLAGSERASATGCKGARFKEGANINKSLLALGNCINNLADGIKHIPFRDSKLTRLLKDSLGGNCQTIMIANVSPSSLSYEDTYNTLKYANRTKKIKSNIKKNIVSCQMHVTGYIKMVEEQKKEIDLLKQKLLTYESGAIEVSPLRKETVTVKEEQNKHISELGNRLLNLLENKKSLYEKVLSLESSDKILCCRIQYKKAADSRLCNLTSAIDALLPEEQNASGKLRVNKSMHYFKKQRDAIRNQIDSLWNELRNLEIELRELNSHIHSKAFASKYADKVALQASEIRRSVVQQQYDHVKKISSLQQCEMQSLSTMVKTMSTTLQNYYNMMNGYGTMTDKMKNEFKQLVKSLEGVRNIKWADSNTTDKDEDFYSMTCLSIDVLSDPINNDFPIFSVFPSDDDENNSEVVENKLMESAKSSSLTGSEPQNLTITYDDEMKLEMPECDDNETTEAGFINPEKLNNTFSCDDHKGKKRMLSEKNQEDIKQPSAKHAKKLITNGKPKSSPKATNSTGKENKTMTVMSSKSIAILNKLKNKQSGFPLSTMKTVAPAESSAGTLKVVRDKERRGLVATHPYQRPNTKSKYPAAPPSSRVPW
ncbi:kinesin-like protein KIF18A [Cephus cinctus]|uniref:Kinesin-like protein KIF18A n=1 Tax=Cephus cinctus TaxID=211228 RepID=A0AAJ7BWU4_CEPCN|nr:kinesin-like protein KIF18A [Cephus cinctus]